MDKERAFRHVAIAMVLLLGVIWAFASAAEKPGDRYPNGQFLVTADELSTLIEKEPVVIVDVRDDPAFDGKMIPEAIRMPWTSFRYSDSSTNMGGLFVGVTQAQKILGEHGIYRNDRIVLYDSVKEDGGATASYVFWILDLLGHENMAILEGGVDSWIAGGGRIVNETQTRQPLLYQAPEQELRLRRLASDDFVYSRLGDPYYQILDVRSRKEYLGEALNTALDGSSLKAGHIPGAFNINYEDNWVDKKTKKIKSYTDLALMYRGISSDAAVITYCHSARRGSFGYFILRLMGFTDVILYDNSWFGWGNPDRYYPVETRLVTPSGDALPEARKDGGGTAKSTSQRSSSPETNKATNNKDYISCGG